MGNRVGVVLLSLLTGLSAFAAHGPSRSELENDWLGSLTTLERVAADERILLDSNQYTISQGKARESLSERQRRRPDLSHPDWTGLKSYMRDREIAKFRRAHGLGDCAPLGPVKTSNNFATPYATQPECNFLRHHAEIWERSCLKTKARPKACSDGSWHAAHAELEWIEKTATLTQLRDRLGIVEDRVNKLGLIRNSISTPEKLPGTQLNWAAPDGVQFPAGIPQKFSITYPGVPAVTRVAGGLEVEPVGPAI
jgi:hypothetical protein